MSLKPIFPLLTILSLFICNDITIRQNLPGIIQQLEADQLKTIQIKQGQTLIQYFTPEAAIVNKISQFCHLHDAYIRIQTLMELPRKKAENGSKNLFNKNKNSLYELSHNSITLYKIDEVKSSIKQVNTVNFPSNCTKNMLFDYLQEILFIFSCQGIYLIKTNTDQASHKLILTHKEPFNSYKVYRFQKLIFEVSYNQGINIYGVNIDDTLINIAHIDKYKNHTLKVADLMYADNRLVIADSNLGVLIYERNHTQFNQIYKISLSVGEELEYNQIIIWKKTLFISVQAQSQSFVAECQFIDGIFYLVRYFKGYELINHIAIYQNKLLIQTPSKIDLMPINRDPRLIKHLFNGYSYSHDNQLISIQPLSDYKFMLTMANSVIIAGWKLIEQKLQCEYSEVGKNQIVIEYPCWDNVDFEFNRECRKISRFMIDVVSSHRDHYLWLLFIIGGVFITVILFLMYWRQIRVNRIKLIYEQIRQFKNKKRQIEFKQVDQKEMAARSRNWDDLSKQIDNQQHPEQIDPYHEYLSQRMTSQRNNLTSK